MVWRCQPSPTGSRKSKPAPPSLVGARMAVVEGSVVPNGWDTTAWIEWGLTTNYGFATLATNAGNSALPVPLGGLIQNLEPGTTYHDRCVAPNYAGLARGPDRAFTTAELPVYIDVFGFQEKGVFQLGVTGSPNTRYRVWESSNLEDWMLLGPMQESAPGQFQFRDSSSTHTPARFYKISSP